jgi:hypothetical protein
MPHSPNFGNLRITKASVTGLLQGRVTARVSTKSKLWLAVTGVTAESFPTQIGEKYY